jgi:hypothetical protein
MDPAPIGVAHFYLAAWPTCISALTTGQLIDVVLGIVPGICPWTATVEAE